MSSSGESHLVSNPSGVQGSSDSSSPGDWIYESSSKEVSLVEEEGPVEEEELAEEESAEEEENSTKEGAPMEEEVPTSRKKSRVGSSRSSTRPSAGSIFEISTVTEDDIAGIHEKFQIPEDFHLHVPRLEDRVTSGSTDCLVMYEDLNAGFRFVENIFELDEGGLCHTGAPQH